MVSLMNGLSSLGAGISQFAGAAGLEQQKSDLAKQQTILADQLATTRESKGRQEAGDIAATAAGKQQQFEAGQGDLQRQSAQAIATTTSSATRYAADVSAAAENYRADVQSKDVYATIASAEPEQAAKILAQNQQTALATVQTKNAQDLQTAHEALQDEMGKGDAADPTRIASLKSQVTSLDTSASTESAAASARAAIYRTDMDAVTHYNTQLVTATAALNSPDMSDTDRTAQKGLIADLKTRLTGAQRALDFSSSGVHGQPAVAPPPPDGVPTGARYSPSMKIWQAPDGRLFDAQGKSTSLPNPQAGPRAVPSPAVPSLGFINQVSP
ncbi:MAG: hypothetical protein ABSC06_38580 [Rhodopila sp.]|jgi:hypothetical protein